MVSSSLLMCFSLFSIISISTRKENFYGNDTVFLYAMNNNGVQEAYFSVLVEPVNDPPLVHAPKSIFLGGKESSDGFQIFDKHRDTFEFSILDPDILNFPGN